ncbi:MAG: hypothetical protein ACR2P6_09265 [Gammaproteobacteria bacterium]
MPYFGGRTLPTIRNSHSVLVYDYYFYLSMIGLAGLGSLPGLLSIALLLAAVAAFMRLPQRRGLVVWSLTIVSLGLFAVAFSNAIYEFDEGPETLDAVALGLPDGEPDCGAAWTAWLEAGWGLGNPCPKGCYRGLTISKQMRMKGLPPFPFYRRELQCWRR